MLRNRATEIEFSSPRGSRDRGKNSVSLSALHFLFTRANEKYTEWFIHPVVYGSINL